MFDRFMVKAPASRLGWVQLGLALRLVRLLGKKRKEIHRGLVHVLRGVSKAER